MNKVGIIGNGYVGSAMLEGFKDCFDVMVWDIVPSKRTVDSFEKLVNDSEIIFICVPTPMKESGDCDISIVESVIRNIAVIRKDVTVVIKSTVLPGTTQNLSEETGLNIAFNPEFLTEKNHIQDFKYQPLIVVGADDLETQKKVLEIYYKFVTHSKYMPLMKSCGSKEAEMFKYMANCFLATKVIFANEIKILCDQVGIDYDTVAELARSDNRLGSTHWSVPGHDGQMGYGGSCFPKDTQGLINYADSNGVNLWLITEATYINEDVRYGRFSEKFEIELTPKE